MKSFKKDLKPKKLIKATILYVPLILQQLGRRRAGQLRFGFVAVLVGLIVYVLYLKLCQH
jgi:hypothetical protein